MLSLDRFLRVQAQFREMEGGYHRANVELKAYLRDGWVLPALPVLVEESASVLGESASEAARREHAGLCINVGAVLQQNGKYEPALAHYEMSLEIRLALEGPEGLGRKRYSVHLVLIQISMRPPQQPQRIFPKRNLVLGILL